MTKVFQELLESGDMTIAEMNKIFERIQFNPVVDWETIPIADTATSEQNLDQEV
jgi:hypothetical protein